jgi:hypothetical protein
MADLLGGREFKLEQLFALRIPLSPRELVILKRQPRKTWGTLLRAVPS